MKILRRILPVFAVLIISGALGYVWGRRDGFVAEQHNMLQVTSAMAMLIRENRSDAVLRFAENQMGYSATDLQRSQGLPNPTAVFDDMSKRRFYDAAFQTASEYINHYPHPDIPVSAVAYIQDQPESRSTVVAR